MAITCTLPTMARSTGIVEWPHVEVARRRVSQQHVICRLGRGWRQALALAVSEFEQCTLIGVLLLVQDVSRMQLQPHVMVGVRLLLLRLQRRRLLLLLLLQLRRR